MGQSDKASCAVACKNGDIFRSAGRHIEISEGGRMLYIHYACYSAWKEEGMIPAKTKPALVGAGEEVSVGG